MKYLLSVIAIIFCGFIVTASAQISDPVHWKYQVVKKGSAQYELVITATIQDGWHIYSHETGKGGPVPTTVTINQSPLIKLLGNVKELGNRQQNFDANFNTQVQYYEGIVRFTQLFSMVANVSTDMSGTIEYMVCNDRECLPPNTIDFSVAIQ
ncbi:MAG: protein-disulfide reductase DsbD family protein [Phycisphaerales bacterium]|nr:protein-disulfide reductase DsbD family protein [Phycisphaerales bacterium]